MKPTTVPHLPDWINSLSPRGITITIQDDQPILTGDATDQDRRLARVHQHALTVAARGTHSTWWNHILNRTTAPIDPDDIPWSCATCGNPNIEILDADLTCWCPDHQDHANTDPWKAVGWGAA